MRSSSIERMRGHGAALAVLLIAAAAVAPAAPAAPENGKRRLTYEEAFGYARQGTSEIPLAERQVLAELPRIVEWLDDERWVESRADLAHPGRRRLPADGHGGLDRPGRPGRRRRQQLLDRRVVA